LGYCVGGKKEIELVQKMCTPHNVNAFGIKFAHEIMKKDGMIAALVDEQLRGKEYLVNQLQAQKYYVNAGEGNFVFIKPKHDASEVTRRLEEHKVLVKHYETQPYNEYIRVSTGSQKAMELFLNVFLKIDKD